VDGRATTTVRRRRTSAPTGGGIEMYRNDDPSPGMHPGWMDGWMDGWIDRLIKQSSHESFLEIECPLYSLSGTAVGAISLLYCEMSGQ
jgi:hypothetical protein